MKLRDILSYLTFPVLLFTFVGLAAWGLDNGMPPAQWGVLLTVLNFTAILGVEQLLPRNPGMNVFRDRQSLNDIGHGLILAVAARPLGGAISVVAVTILAGLRGEAAATWWPGSWFFEAQLLWGLLFYTFMDYWTHRALHSVDRLWWFHAVHHDTPQMHIMKSGRLHAGEELFAALLRPVPLLLLGAPAEVLVWMELLSVFLGNLVHSNIDQRFPSWAHYVLPTVQLHNLHHAADRRYQDSNYSGFWPVWDVIFGSFNHPDRSTLGELGIERSPVPQGFLQQVLFPFRAQVRPPR
jgi:sterol desaturase/sphingolipid hydroxylase (fatty acid hydroxylase superfamily)